jgi:hypothetical protein
MIGRKIQLASGNKQINREPIKPTWHPTTINKNSKSIRVQESSLYGKKIGQLVKIVNRSGPNFFHTNHYGLQQRINFTPPSSKSRNDQRS